MLYNVLVKNNQLNFNSGGLTINFAQVDPFYHYFFNGGVYRATPDYEAKYSESDISSITDLLYVVADLTSDLLVAPVLLIQTSFIQWLLQMELFPPY